MMYSKLIADEEGVTWSIEQWLVDLVKLTRNPVTELQLFNILGNDLDLYKEFCMGDEGPFHQVGFVNAR